MPCLKLNTIARASRLHYAGLAAALLLPVSSDLFAHPGHDPIPVTQGQNAVSGQFINLKALTPGTRRSADISTDQLTQETGLRIHGVAPSDDPTYKDLQLLVGKSIKLTRGQQSEDDVIIASRPDGSFVALLPQADAIIRGEADGQQTLLRPGPSPFNENTPDSVLSSTPEIANQIEARGGLRSFQAERNNAGEIIIDLLAGFSEKSAGFIKDPEAFALTQATTVNRALQNSKVNGVRVRLVGIQVIKEDAAITATSLSKVKSMFAEGIKQYGADMVASFVMGIPKEDTAIGWGNVNGRYTISAIKNPTAFRHELGHNIGGRHCSDGSSYRFGYSNGRVKTILCGNQIQYYSNPDLKDSHGVPLGDARTANMARVWRENAAKASAYSAAVVPLDSEQPKSLFHQAVDLEPNQTAEIPVDVPAGTQRLVVSVIPGPYSETENKVQLSLIYGSNQHSAAYDYRSQMAYITALSINNPKAGRWYVKVDSNRGKAIKNLIVSGQALALKEDTAQARYIRLLALSSVDGKPDASIAELNLADAVGQPLPRNWNILSASSAQTNTPVSNILDGNTKSYWASANGSGYPHQLIIDLGKEKRFSQLQYLPRQDQGSSGNIKAYEVYGSNNANGPWTLLSDGEFSGDNGIKYASLKPTEKVAPPKAVISGVATATAGQKVVLDASGSSDPQGHALDFSWKVTPELDFTIDSTSLSFTAPNVSTDTRYHFTLRVGNGKQISSATHEVLIKGNASTAQCGSQWEASKAYSENDKVVHKGRQYQARWWIKGAEPGNSAVTGPDGSGKVWKDLGPCDSGATVAPPVANISGISQAKAGQQVQLSAAGSSDPAGLPLTYHWKVSPTLSFTSRGAQLNFSAPKLTQDTLYRFTVDVSNGQHSASKVHSVKVLADTEGASGGNTSGGTSGNCQSPWRAQQSYQGGDKVSHNGHFYTARWWTKGNEPGTEKFTGDEGSGKVWRDDGACR